MRQYVLAALALGGCALELDDNVGEVVQGVESPNKLAANKLAANKLAANSLSSKTLTAANLSSSTLLNTADGREVLTYLASCALAAGDSFVAKVSDGITYSFPGSIGLAPSWKTQALAADKQRWVTACILARTNYYGVQVQLSLRGALGPLGPDAGETTSFATLEGGFYGNLFDPAGPKLYACVSNLKATNPSVSTLPQRQCARSDDGVTTWCGFTFTGKCQDATKKACGRYTVNFDQCHTPNPVDHIHEVITVFVAGNYPSP